MAPATQNQSCATCARRKVKCDRLNPCSRCSRAQIECKYSPPAPSRRHRKRPPDEDILAKIAEYEDLLRENNIEFQPLDNTWISSALEAKLLAKPHTVHPTTANNTQLESQQIQHQPQPRLNSPQCEAVKLWNDLPKELHDTTVRGLKRGRVDAEDDDEKFHSPCVAVDLSPYTGIGDRPALLELHPEPKHILRLWQIFAETVNPLTKVIHYPSLQTEILEVLWTMQTVSKPLEAVMFALYALSISSMKIGDCIQIFGETRSVLLNRYASAAVQALTAAGLHLTRDLKVLQAFVLYLLVDTRSELSATTVAIATRIGHKMRLHHTGADTSISVFEQEMRLRVWWQIMLLESQARRKLLNMALPMADCGDVRMPLNVNDAELHPNMVHCPTTERSRATEMLYCLMKYDIDHYIRMRVITAAASTTNAHDLTASITSESMARKRDVLIDLERIYEDRYICHCDPSIPLHKITATVARLTIHCQRFGYHHPQHQPDGGRHMSREDQDMVFDSSIQLLQLYREVRLTSFSAQLLRHIHGGRTEVAALVYMVSELRHRLIGDLVNTAWGVLEEVYEECPQLRREDGSFYVAFRNLTLEAWDARRQQLKPQTDLVPRFIGELLVMRQNGERDTEEEEATDIGETLPDEDFQLGWINDDVFDWTFWDDFADG